MTMAFGRLIRLEARFNGVIWNLVLDVFVFGMFVGV